MTLPEWVDPASPDDPRSPAGEGSRVGEPSPDPLDPADTDKPVLEWTKEDWARWIESSAQPSPLEADVEPAPATDAPVDDVEPQLPIVDVGLPDDEPVPAHPVVTDLAPPPLLWSTLHDAAPTEAPPVTPRAEVALPPPPPPVTRTEEALPPSAAPATPPARTPITPSARPRPAHPTIERTHPVRSALALLGVALTVGIILAGLITVTIFAVGVALRRAVG